ncbi:MAG: alpha/beta hydrolase [Sphingobium sp.]
MPDIINFAFLHGGGQGAWIWHETIAALKAQGGERVRAVAFDMPGCGAKRDADVSGLSVRDAAAVFIADLANSGLTDIILVGHSNAGTILPLVAAQRPDLIRRYVYLSCIAPPPGQSVLDVMRQGRPDAQQSSISGGKLHDMFCNDMDPAYAEAFMGKLHSDHWPTPAVLPETDWVYDHLADKATSYIVCMKDRALLPDWQEVFAARLHAQRRVYLDAGHQAMNTRPHGLAEILLVEAAA